MRSFPFQKLCFRLLLRCSFHARYAAGRRREGKRHRAVRPGFVNNLTCGETTEFCRTDPAPSAGLTTPAHQSLKWARIFRDAGTVVRDGRTLDMNIANKTILVTGANRGIGRALLEEAL